MIEVVLNDRLGKKVRVKCNEDDTIGDLKKLAAAQLGTRPEKLKIQKWYTVYKDHITLEDYEIHDGMGLELYYQWIEDFGHSIAQRLKLVPICCFSSSSDCTSRKPPLVTCKMRLLFIASFNVAEVVFHIIPEIIASNLRVD